MNGVTVYVLLTGHPYLHPVMYLGTGQKVPVPVEYLTDVGVREAVRVIGEGIPRVPVLFPARDYTGEFRGWK